MTKTLRSKIMVMAWVIPVVFAADQLIKQLVVRWIPLGGSVAVIPGLFDLVHTRNKGAAFGLFSTIAPEIRVPFFFITSTLALILITFYFFKLHEERRSFFVCLSLILGGALGNIFDRICWGEVIDFLSFHWYNKTVRFEIWNYYFRFRLEWPAFNVADMAISVAVIGLMILMTLKKDPGAPS